MNLPVLMLAVVVLLSGCGRSQPAVAEEPAAVPGQAAATFAGGCFWCTESDFEKLPGVIAAQSGYSGGRVVNPSYEQVSAGDTGHTEVVRVIFDPKKISYAQLLEHFWRDIDPTDAGGQFCDRGSQYRSEIFFHDESQRAAAEASKQKLQQSGVLKAPVATGITRFEAFYPAEDYHQDYYKKNPVRYNYYRTGCGRERTLEKIWGKSPSP
jgi:methionine-S-sulfoxide reductase